MLVVSSADEKFVPLYAALVHSARLFNPEIRFRLLDSGITEKTKALLKEFAARKSIDLEILECSGALAQLQGLPVPQTFMRVLIPELFPGEDRALYLDCDITVIGSLRELFEINLGNFSVAAMPDSIRSTVEGEIERLGTDFGGHYFNAGVMLIDIQEWRRQRITEAALAFAKGNISRLRYLDQSTLNYALQGNFHKLDDTWNFYNPMDFSAEKDIRILHHTYFERPWNSVYSPFLELHKYHRSQTPWPLPELARPLHIRIRDGKRWILGKAGVKRYRAFHENIERVNSIRDSLGKRALDAARSMRA